MIVRFHWWLRPIWKITLEDTFRIHAEDSRGLPSMAPLRLWGTALGFSGTKYTISNHNYGKRTGKYNFGISDTIVLCVWFFWQQVRLAHRRHCVDSALILLFFILFWASSCWHFVKLLGLLDRVMLRSPTRCCHIVLRKFHTSHIYLPRSSMHGRLRVLQVATLLSLQACCSKL